MKHPSSSGRDRAGRVLAALCVLGLAAWLPAAEGGDRPSTAPAPPTQPAEPAFPIVLYTKDQAPAAPKLSDLPLKAGLSQYGITWTLEKPVPVGQFVNGDWYAVGPVKVVAIDPRPLFGAEEVPYKDDPREKERPDGKYARNGSTVNPSGGKYGSPFDSRIGRKAANKYDPNQLVMPPVSLRPGDSLTSTISVGKIGEGKKMLWSKSPTTPVKTAAVLTCLAEPAPPDAFRPSYAGKWDRLYLARDLRREILPRLQPAGTEPNFAQLERYFQRPWVDIVADEWGAPIENMPIYGREVSRAAGLASLALCLDRTAADKERLVVHFVQAGIDLWGLGRDGLPAAWAAIGGHGLGRKWIIVLSGMLLGDKDMQSPSAKYPHLRFSEDAQTMFDRCWTGANVVFAGHMGKEGHPQHPGWGAYEHLTPDKWEGTTGESYRHCCTSHAWVGQALAARILHAERIWNHDAFFAYVDRWMTEDDTEFVKTIKQATGKDFTGIRQGEAADPFVKAMWTKYRDNLPPAADGHKDPPADKTWKGAAPASGPALDVAPHESTPK